jgi:hypothetical protein
MGSRGWLWKSWDEEEESLNKGRRCSLVQWESGGANSGHLMLSALKSGSHESVNHHVTHHQDQVCSIVQHFKFRLVISQNRKCESAVKCWDGEFENNLPPSIFRALKVVVRGITGSPARYWPLQESSAAPAARSIRAEVSSREYKLSCGLPTRHHN